jgi:hypothetical protein
LPTSTSGVVVGFYFGTQRRILEVETEQGTVRQVIEHDNPTATVIARRPITDSESAGDSGTSPGIKDEEVPQKPEGEK